MTDNNRNDYSDFFKNNNQEGQGTGENNNQEVSTSQKDESTYYAYGPYREKHETNNLNHPIDLTPVAPEVQSNANTDDASASKPLRSLMYGDGKGNTNSYAPAGGSGRGPGEHNSWSSPPKKRKSILGYFSAFTAGVLLVGSMMWVADYNNWFTKGASVAAGNKGQNASSDVTTSAFGTSSPDITQIVDQSSKAVVLIESFVKPQSSQGSSHNNDWFRQFFGDEFFTTPESNKDGGSELKKAGMGTGFIFEESGYILTNQHVIDGADEVRVTVEGHEKPFVAEVLGTSYELDLAALKIKSDEPFPTLPLGNADEVKVGDWVVAIGNPYGFDHTVTVGVLSAKGRPISIQDSKGTRNYENLFQTDASINPGNSGGPLLNMRGEVIGINTAVSSQAQGIGFAIPSSTVSQVLDNLKNDVEIPSPYIGVQLGEIDKDWAKELKLESTEGALIGTVERRSPAFEAGIRPYDVVVDIDGKKIKNPTDLQEVVRGHKVGDKVKFGIIRDGQRIELDVKIGDKKAAAQQ
jgi:serine protease Do